MTTGDFTKDGLPGTIHAFDALDLSNELWNSDLAGSRDTLGEFAKFAPPTVANGLVYVPTFSNSVGIYGILGSGSQPSTGTISTIVNGASFLHGPISPGEIVTIFGANMGPTEQAGPDLEGESISETAGGHQSTVRWPARASALHVRQPDQCRRTVRCHRSHFPGSSAVSR